MKDLKHTAPSLLRRYRAYKKILMRRIKALKGSAFMTKLKALTRKELKELAIQENPGIPFTNVARDIRDLTEGENYDAEFDVLWRGQTIPWIIEDYSESYLKNLVQGVFTSDQLSEKLSEYESRRRTDGKRVFEEL